MTTVNDYYQQGNLTQAIRELSKELAVKPSDAAKRAFLVELLCIKGDLERADDQLDILASLEPDKVLTTGTWRQLIRAAQMRKEVYEKGRTPDVVDDPTSRIKSLLNIQIGLRENDIESVEGQTKDLENGRESCSAIVNGTMVDDVRDLDDTCAGVLEVMATNGQYFWVDFSQISTLEFEPPKRPLDILWRKASIVLHKGTEGEVFIPSIYATPTDDEEALLGRKTEWIEDGGLVRGIGQRNLLVGDQSVPIMEIESIEFTIDAAAMTG